jgi:hypothetical protein
MSNSPAKAAKWTEFVAGRPEFPVGDRLRAAFRAGKITRLCDCGCNSFDIDVPPGTAEPIASAGHYRLVFELEFRTEGNDGTLGFLVFANEEGQLAGIDVEYCANSFPLPDEPMVKEPPYHVCVSVALPV